MVTGVRYPVVLFDWDGCLATTLDAWLQAYDAACVSFGIPADAATIRAQFGEWDLAKLGVPREHHAAYVDELRRHGDARLASVGLYDGAGELLSTLRSQGVVLGLVTSSWRPNLLPVLERTGVAELFSTVVTADDVASHKPHPEPVLLALEQLGADAGEAVMVGDSGKDIGAAAAAGVDSVLIHGETHAAFHDLAELRSMQPTHVVASFEELHALLLP
jgi:pyrophosphatase PpaX